MNKYHYIMAADLTTAQVILTNLKKLLSKPWNHVAFTKLRSAVNAGITNSSLPLSQSWKL